MLPSWHSCSNVVIVCSRDATGGLSFGTLCVVNLLGIAAFMAVICQPRGMCQSSISYETHLLVNMKHIGRPVGKYRYPITHHVVKLALSVRVITISGFV